MFWKDADSGVNGWYLITTYDPSTPDVFDADWFSVSGVTDSSDIGTVMDENHDKLGYGMQWSVVPEPASTALLCAGHAALFLRRRRQTLG